MKKHATFFVILFLTTAKTLLAQSDPNDSTMNKYQHLFGKNIQFVMNDLKLQPSDTIGKTGIATFTSYPGKKYIILKIATGETFAFNNNSLAIIVPKQNK